MKDAEKLLYEVARLIMVVDDIIIHIDNLLLERAKTRDEIYLLCAELIKAGKNTKVRSVFDDFGVKRVADLKEDQLLGFYKALDRI